MNLTKIPQEERPREKLKKYGVSALTDSELLALILRIGNKKENITNTNFEKQKIIY